MKDLIPERRWKGKLAGLKLPEADFKHCEKIVSDGLRGMVVMEVAQRRAVTVPYLEPAPARAVMMTAIAVLNKETHECERRQFIGQVQTCPRSARQCPHARAAVHQTDADRVVSNSSSHTGKG